MHTTLTTIVAAGIVATATPAWAISVGPSEPGGSPRTAVPERRGLDSTPLIAPWLAAGLAIAPSIALTTALSAVPAGSPLQDLNWVVPFTFGLGHFYAGDPLRGTLVTLGGPVAMLAGAGLGGALGGLSRTGGTPWLGMGAWTAATAYGGWAAYDAYLTAQHKNQLYAPGPVSTGPLPPGTPQRPLGNQ